MAVELLKQRLAGVEMDVEARGIVVLFPEPMNQKAQAIMASHGMKMDNYLSKQLEPDDFSEGTLVITFETKDYNKIASMEGAQNVYILTHLTGEELEILDPYGADLVTYGICYETMQKSIDKLVDILPTME